MEHADETLAALDAVIAGASRAERPALVVALAARLATLGAGLSGAPAAVADGGDRNLDVNEAAGRLGVSRDFVYRHAAELPSVRLGRRLLFSERALVAFLARRRA